MSTHRIPAKIATFIDDHQLAFNVGSQQGVVEGATVVLHRVVDVTDPDTKRSLGSVRLQKALLRVNHVQGSLCVARVTDRMPGRGGANAAALAALSGSPGLKKLVEKSGWGEVPAQSIEFEIGEPAEVQVETADEEEPPF